MPENKRDFYKHNTFVTRIFNRNSKILFDKQKVYIEIYQYMIQIYPLSWKSKETQEEEKKKEGKLALTSRTTV